MLVILRLTLAGLAICCTAAAFGQDRNWENLPSFDQLREEYGQRDDFFKICEIDRPTKSVATALNEKDWRAAIDLGMPWLQSCPVDIRIHYFTAIALRESDRRVESETHLAWVDGLMRSIVASGDGETAATAYVTISVAEEYDALFLFGLTPKSQSLVEADEPVDAFEAENKDGETFTVYFTPRAHFERLDRSLFGADGPDE